MKKGDIVQYFLILFTCVLVVGFIVVGANWEEIKEYLETKIEAKESADRDAELNGYIEAVDNGNFAQAHSVLNVIHSEYVDKLGKASGKGYEIDDFKIISKKYYAALEYIYSKEFTLILTNGDAQAADKIVFLLSEIQTDGICKEGECSYSETLDNDEKGQNRFAYANECYVINKLCDKALLLAINRKNKEFAQNLINYYKPDVSTREVKKEKEANQYFIDFKYDTKNAAIARLEEAIKDGLFE